MKGIMDFLERAGLVSADSAYQESPNVDSGQVQERVVSAPDAAIAVRSGSAPLNLSDIYINERVPPSNYPAERLLRLVDGLSAMDEAVRFTAIKAMDAADESWSIADPIADAKAKVKALAAHAQRLELSLQTLEQETQARVNEVRTRQEQAVGAIRKQITDLEALAARELERAARETAEYEGTLSTAREQTSRELDEIMRISTQLQNMATQYGAFISTVQG